MTKIKGRVAIVTGAGAGIGKEIVRVFAAEGARVVASDIDAASLENVVKEIQAQGGDIEGFRADVSDENQIQELLRYTKSRYNSPHILVNNAGIMDDFMPVTEITTEKWNQIFEVNLNSVYFMCHHAIPNMLQESRGNIINIASVGGLGGGKAGAAYTASKHGVIGLSKNVAYMFAMQGIRCNVIAPGGVETTISEKMNPSAFGYERMSMGIGSVPRSGKPLEIAQIALFLASEESSFINGAVITADGGWTAY